MLGFLKGLFSRTEKPPDEGRIVVANIDAFDEDELEGFQAAVTKHSGIDFFNGRVDHGYSLSKVENKDQCPRCNAPTRQQYANFIYNTQIAPRVLLAPAGYFCTKCKSVVVDEQLLRKGATRGFEYRGVLGLDYEEKKPPDIFTTWNGKTFDFGLGEDAKLVYYDSDPGAYSSARWEKMKRKKRMAKQSRKRNRRK